MGQGAAEVDGGDRGLSGPCKGEHREQAVDGPRAEEGRGRRDSMNVTIEGLTEDTPEDDKDVAVEGLAEENITDD